MTPPVRRTAAKAQTVARAGDVVLVRIAAIAEAAERGLRDCGARVASRRERSAYGVLGGARESTSALRTSAWIELKMDREITLASPLGGPIDLRLERRDSWNDRHGRRALRAVHARALALVSRAAGCARVRGPDREPRSQRDALGVVQSTRPQRPVKLRAYVAAVRPPRERVCTLARATDTPKLSPPARPSMTRAAVASMPVAPP